MTRRKRPTRLTREQGERFRARWASVREVEIEELRAMPIDVRLDQLAGLMASARALGWTQLDRVDDEETRDRWKRLRRGYGVEH